MWEISEYTIDQDKNFQKDALYLALLDAGWEPFAVTSDQCVEKIWMKRVKPS